MKQKMLALVGVMLGTGWGWAGTPTMEQAAAGGAGILNSAAAKLSSMAPGVNLPKAAPQTARSSSQGDVTVPLPETPRLDAEQMKSLAQLGASIYQAQGHGFMSHWSNRYCVAADDYNLTGGGSPSATRCIKVRGKVRGDRSFELKEVELSLFIDATGTESFLGRPTGQVRVRVAEGSCPIDGDGAIGRWGWTQYYSGTMNFNLDVRQHEIDFWTSYKG